MRCAIIENGVVVNVVIADPQTQLPADWVISETAGIGWIFDGGEFTAPDAQQLAPVQNKHISRLAFKNRMTSTERKGIRAAAKVNADVEDFVDLADSATYVDLDRPDTRAKVQALETFGLLGVGRALQILDTPIEDVERYRG